MSLQPVAAPRGPRPPYDWRRFWYPASSAPRLQDGGFLVDPDGEWGRYSNPDVLPLEQLEKVCSDGHLGARHWGAENWARLQRRLASLLGAPTLRDMDGVPGNCHQLHADRAGQFAVDLWGAYRLVFEPDHEPIPALPDGGVDRARVTAIRITEVVDYHGK